MHLQEETACDALQLDSDLALMVCLLFVVYFAETSVQTHLSHLVHQKTDEKTSKAERSSLFVRLCKFKMKMIVFRFFEA